jgi:hypothetical protein
MERSGIVLRNAVAASVAPRGYRRSRFLTGLDERRRPAARHTQLVDSEAARPTALTIMVEHVDIDPVWDRPFGIGEPVDLTMLGVNGSLVQRLRVWNEEYGRTALTDFEWDSAQTAQAWHRTGLYLALELQNELWDIEIRYQDGSPEQAMPVRERRKL